MFKRVSELIFWIVFPKKIKNVGGVSIIEISIERKDR
jgi:hypothetical protein